MFVATNFFRPVHLQITIPQKSSYTLLLIFSLAISLLLFFSDPTLHLIFDGNTAYSDFSTNIFTPNTSYFAESILLPLMAKLVGANSSLAAYKIFCSISTVLVLPIVSVAAYEYYKKIDFAAFYTLALASAFPWFRVASVGQPDPPTILFLILTALQRDPKCLFICLFLASLSHFSLVLCVIPTLFLLVHATEATPSIQKKKLYKTIFLSVLCGKLSLSLWYLIFDYQLATRVDWIIDRGLTFFVDRYESDPIGFWTTPNTFFLCLFIGLSIWLLRLKKFKFFFAMWSGLAAAYTANFITIDGYRITAVILAAPLAFSVREVLLIYRRQLKIIFEKFKVLLYIVTSTLKNYWFDVLCAIAIIGCWAYTLKIATNRGLLINWKDSFMFGGYAVEPNNAFILVASVFLIFVFATKPHRERFLAQLACLLFMAPLPLITLQYFRQLFLFNQSLGAVGNGLAIVFLIGSLLFLYRLAGPLVHAALKAKTLLRSLVCS